MTKRLPLLLLSLFMVISMNADPITKQQALQKARQFMPGKSFAPEQMARKVLGKTSATTTQSLYVFNVERNGGFVIVSGDDATDAILGYSTRGNYNEENMPENFRFWMERRAAEIEAYQRYAASNPPISRKAIRRKVAAHAPIDPLIITTWDQGNADNATNSDGVYNTHLPMINGQYPCTGCVATASAQIMYYYQWPQGMTAGVPGYTLPGAQANTSEALPPIQFQWDKMKTSYTFNDPNTEAVNAVADLMLYCGYAALMNYGIDGSGTYTNNIAQGMSEYFGYNPDTWQYLSRNSYSIEDWDQMIYNELANGRPLIYDGSFDGGHAFICDGYDGAGMYHFNWGWGGWANGFFRLQATNPYGPGSLDRMGFIDDQSCLIGIQPSSWPDIIDVNANDTWSDPVIEGTVATAGGISVEGTTVKVSFSNYNEDGCNFGFGIGLLNNDGTVTPLDTKYEVYKTVTLPPNYGFPPMDFDFSSYSLADGTHALVPISLLNEESEWRRCKPANLYFEVTVSGEQREIVVHPVEKLIVNEFDLSAGGIPNNYQHAKVNITNEGDNINKDLYIFIGTPEDKGEYRNRHTMGIASGNTKECRIFLGKMEAGSYTMWLTGDYAGTQVLAKRDIEITQDVRATDFSIVGDALPGNPLQVDVTVENHAGDYTKPLYLFASPTETKEFAYAAGAAIESGSQETLSFYFVPGKPGTWNLWIATDKDGNDVIGQTTVKVIEPSVVTVKNISREYGEENPAFEYTVTGGALEGEPEIVCEATATSPVGKYPINITIGSITNKMVTLNAGVLTITKAPLSVTAKSYSMKQGEALPAFEAVYSGFKNEETSSVLTKQPVITCEATSASMPGEYEIVVGGAEAQNYSISYTNGKLVVTEADPVTIIATSYTREYGEDNPAFEFTSEGAALEGQPEISCEATATSPAGEYPIIIKKGSVKNYNDTYTNGVLTITKAPLSVTAKSYSMKQGEALPMFEAEYSGFKNEETSSVLTKQPSITCEATSASMPGEYEIVVSGAEAQNYNISYTNGKLVVTEADPVTIIATSYTREYGEDNPAFEFTSEGAALEGQPEISCEATATSPAGEYPIIIKKGSVKNYNDTYTNGVLTITKAPLTVTVEYVEREEAEENPPFVLIYSGWKNGEDESVLEEVPVATTTATVASPVGEYPVTISGGKAKNYDFLYVDGVLVVTESDAIRTINSNGEAFDVYAVDGKKVRQQTKTLKGLPKGIYIVNGKKISI